ncbi:hypothetical protein CN130_01115 [Sinorhizobium meliloti]|nr:hypothetical protein CN130_01115 [Sinorhizobium meliloti]
MILYESISHSSNNLGVFGNPILLSVLRGEPRAKWDVGRPAVCGVHAPLIFQLRRSEADPRRSNELTEEYLTSSL